MTERKYLCVFDFDVYTALKYLNKFAYIANLPRTVAPSRLRHKQRARYCPRNEDTGIWLKKRLEAQPQRLRPSPKKRNLL